MNNKKILITTGIYPPKIGGPAQYAKNLKETFEEMGHIVKIKTYQIEDVLPSGIRHVFFLFKIIPAILLSDIVFALDTFCVGLPSVVASKIFGRKCIIRTGGDFLWERYIERTNRKILLRNFYETEKSSFSFKEKVIFNLTKWTLNNASRIIFSTDWQRQIFIKAYSLDINKTDLVENYYGPKISSAENLNESKESCRIFIASARNLIWKNIDILKNVFNDIKIKHPKLILFTDNLPYPQFMSKISKSYAVILGSLGDISPNFILDAIRMGKPFICTKEIGIYDRIKDAGIFVDPLNKKEIEKAILDLLDEDGYKKAKEKVEKFNFMHTWKEIATEFLQVFNSIK